MGYGSEWSNHVMNAAANYIHVYFPSRRILGQHAKIAALDSKAMFIGTSRYSITKFIQRRTQNRFLILEYCN